jgi:hypothetical protein
MAAREASPDVITFGKTLGPILVELVYNWIREACSLTDNPMVGR